MSSPNQQKFDLAIQTVISAHSDLVDTTIEQSIIIDNQRNEIQRLNDRVLHLEERQFSVVYHLNLQPSYERGITSIRAGHEYKDYIWEMVYFNQQNPQVIVRTLSVQEYQLLKYVYDKEIENSNS